ncbi:unnamed protein product [Citrullus colocynthis]|uniref:Uncharacterized protein n=1 Tax=Citrullus colocynthis TaxID=252529 RepID=A0ABP0XTN6_9ROSI
MKSPSSHELWRPPAESWKMNSDASWSEELGAVEKGLKTLRSRFEIVILSFLVESDFVEAIASLYEIDSDLLLARLDVSPFLNSFFGSNLSSSSLEGCIFSFWVLISPSGLMLLSVRLIVRWILVA